MQKLNILVLSFDWRNIFETNFSELAGKLERDRLGAKENNFFLINWSSKSYYSKINNIATTHLKTRLTRLRIVYDFLSIFIVLWTLKKRKFKPDIIFLKDFPFVFACVLPKLLWRSKIAFLLSASPANLAATRPLAWPRVWYVRLSEFFGKYFIDYFFANGQATKKYLVKLGIKADRITIMTGNVIKRDQALIDSAQPGKVRQKHKIGKDKKILLAVGRLEPEKGYDRLLKVFSGLNRDDLILIIVGDGVLKNELKKQTSELGLDNKVIFIGKIEHKEIWNYYTDADIFILLSYSEGAPMAMREAMYMNVPVIGSRIAGIKDFIGENSERGFFWEEQDGIEALNNIINKCLSGSGEIVEIKKQARAYIEIQIADERIINDFI